MFDFVNNIIEVINYNKDCRKAEEIAQACANFEGRIIVAGDHFHLITPETMIEVYPQTEVKCAWFGFYFDGGHRYWGFNHWGDPVMVIKGLLNGTRRPKF